MSWSSCCIRRSPRRPGALAGIPANELDTLLDATEQQIENGGIPLASYVAPGNLHTVSTTDDFYTIEVDGVRLVDWFRSLINDPEPPPDVHCAVCAS